MPWYAWMALGLGTVIALVAVTLRLLRLSARGRRFLALSSRGKLRFGRALLRDEGTPLVAKVALVLMAAYLALPFDLIPDFLPVIGQADDVLVVVVVVALLIVLIPREPFESALGEAEANERGRVVNGEARADRG
jgi:uncharacterized membrane protein YkvA (DUF1232 family)